MDNCVHHFGADDVVPQGTHLVPYEKFMQYLALSRRVACDCVVRNIYDVSSNPFSETQQLCNRTQTYARDSNYSKCSLQRHAQCNLRQFIFTNNQNEHFMSRSGESTSIHQRGSSNIQPKTKVRWAVRDCYKRRAFPPPVCARQPCKPFTARVCVAGSSYSRWTRSTTAPTSCRGPNCVCCYLLATTCTYK